LFSLEGAMHKDCALQYTIYIHKVLYI